MLNKYVVIGLTSVAGLLIAKALITYFNRKKRKTIGSQQPQIQVPEGATKEEKDISVLFTAHAAAIRASNGGWPNSTLLALYSLYKQGTVGDCNTQKPSEIDFTAKAQWNAWMGLRGMSVFKARKEYVALASSLLDAIPRGQKTDDADDEDDDEDEDDVVTKKKGKSSKSGSSKSGGGGGGSMMGPAQSRPVNEDEDEGKDDIFAWASEGDVNKLRKAIKKDGNIDVKDPDGQTPLHFAADRGRVDAVKVLLELKASMNLQDDAGLTPLHLACTCGNVEVARLLLEAGADPDREDSDGTTARQEAEGNAALLALFPEQEE